MPATDPDCDCENCNGISTVSSGMLYLPGCDCICHHLRGKDHVNFTKRNLKSRYNELIPIIRAYARKKGYAIGVHGSLQRDLDLIAAPWGGRSISPRELMTGIMKKVKGFPSGHSETIKPCGRLSYSIMLPGKMMEGKWIRGYIDISIMPKTKPVQ